MIVGGGGGGWYTLVVSSRERGKKRMPLRLSKLGQDKISLDTTVVRTESLGGLVEEIFKNQSCTLSKEV